jgi:hypothetical protein
MRPIKYRRTGSGSTTLFSTYSRLFLFQARVSGLVAAYPGYTPTCVTDSSGSNLYRFGLLFPTFCWLVHSIYTLQFIFLKIGFSQAQLILPILERIQIRIRPIFICIIHAQILS